MDRCEGDVRVHCPGGRGSLPYYHPRRTDCRAEAKRCVPALDGATYTSCWASLGACDVATFVPHCEPNAPTALGGRMTICVHGEELPGGISCDTSAPAPSASARPAGSGS